MPERAPKKKNQPPIQEPKTEWHDTFLAGLRLCPVVSYAARMAKVSRRVVYEHREKFPEFASEWQDALAEGVEMLEAEAHRRAKRVSDTLMIFLLKAHKPAMYRERYEVAQTNLNINWDDLTENELERIAAGESAASVLADRATVGAGTARGNSA